MSGPKLTSACNSGGGAGSADSRVTWCCSSRGISLSSLIGGIVVVNMVDVAGSLPALASGESGDGQVTGALNLPVTCQPCIKIASTLSAATCSLKKEYGISIGLLAPPDMMAGIRAMNQIVNMISSIGTIQLGSWKRGGGCLGSGWLGLLDI